jgi:hypothetical protein
MIKVEAPIVSQDRIVAGRIIFRWDKHLGRVSISVPGGESVEISEEVILDLAACIKSVRGK